MFVVVIDILLMLLLFRIVLVFLHVIMLYPGCHFGISIYYRKYWFNNTVQNIIIVIIAVICKLSAVVVVEAIRIY